MTILSTICASISGSIIIYWSKKPPLAQHLYHSCNTFVMPKKSGRSRSASSRASEFTHEHKWIVGAVLAVAIVGIVYYLYEWYESVTVTVTDTAGKKSNYQLELGTYKASGGGSNPDITIYSPSTDSVAFTIAVGANSKLDMTDDGSGNYTGVGDSLQTINFMQDTGGTSMIYEPGNVNYAV